MLPARPSMRRRFSRLEAMPPAVLAIVAELRQHPTARFVERIYALHPPRPAGGESEPGGTYPFAFAQAATSAWVANQTLPFALAWRMSSSRIQMRER